MINTLPEMRALVSELGASTWTLCAIGALYESGLAEHLREPQSVDALAARCPSVSRGRIERCLAVAVAMGVVVVDGERYRLAEGALPFSKPPMRAALEGDIRSTLMQALALLDSARGDGKTVGWRHTDTALLQAQGDASAAFAPMFKTMIAPALGDIGARLERPGARFLDVGVGVGALAIAMCKAWPELSAVGVDVFDVPLGMAAANIARASLTDRIELRRGPVEELGDEEAFELAWLPAFFIREEAVPAAAARVRASLRPGGWILLPIWSPAGDARQRAVWGLVTESWGGAVLSAPDAESLLTRSGLSTVRTIAGPPWAPALVVGQR